MAGYEYPTPIQAGLIPRALTGVDVVGQARTGTGKTASFAIPILEHLQLGKDIHHPQAIVLVPTRELAVQVRDEFDKLSTAARCIAWRSTAASRSAGRSKNSQRGADRRRHARPRDRSHRPRHGRSVDI